MYTFSYYIIFEITFFSQGEKNVGYTRLTLNCWIKVFQIIFLSRISRLFIFIFLKKRNKMKVYIKQKSMPFNWISFSFGHL